MSKRKKAAPEFVPKVIEADDGDDFVAFIPQQIEADWHEKWGPLLEGLPLNVMFAGFKNGAQAGKQSLIKVLYWPNLATFHEDSERKEMWYFTKPTNGYWIRVIFEKATGRWPTEKFKGRKLIRTAFGSTFDSAMMHTTMGGPESAER